MFDIILAIVFGCLAWGSWHEYTTNPDKYKKYSEFAKKAVVVGSGILAVIFLCLGLFGGHSKKQPAAYYKLGTPISKVAKNANSHSDGAYYTVKGRSYVRYYQTTNSAGKKVVSAVKFNYYETDDGSVSNKRVLKDYRKVTASDLKETSKDHYYSKKTGKHYWSSETQDETGKNSQTNIHLTYDELN